MSEHAHLYSGHSDFYEPHVSLDDHVEEIAAHAVRNIPGGPAAVQQYFNTRPIPTELPQNRHGNQHLHLGWDGR